MVRIKLRAVLSGGVVAALLLALVGTTRPATAWGCPTVARGSQGPCVQQLQDKLGRLGLMPSTHADGVFGGETDGAVREFQGRIGGLDVDGVVGPMTWDKLDSASVDSILAYGFPPVCLQPGIVICVSKRSQQVLVMRDAQVILTLDARFGDDRGPEYATPEGRYSIIYKVKDEVSRQYNNAPMPYTNYFVGGYAIHFSPDFAAGVDGNVSHGCVRLRDENGAAAIFYYVPVGTPVFIWS